MVEAARSVDAIIDGGPWTGRQKLATALVALAVVLDGFDSQLLGFAIPALINEWHVTRADFAPALASGLVGMALGSALAGRLGDQYGRKRALLASAYLFSIATAAIAWVDSLTALTALRLFAGLGIGGVLPNATTLVSEFTPARNGSTAVIVSIVCFPLGGMLAGLVAADVLPTLGWRALFLMGGCGGVLVTTVLAFTFPESPRYLARFPQRRHELDRVMARLGHPIPATVQLAPVVESSTARSTPVISTLFSAEFARDTLALWAAFFACLACVYMAFSWLPSMLAAQGMDLASTSRGLAAYNMGGVLGPLTCAWLVHTRGSRPSMIGFAIGGAATALALNLIDLNQTTNQLALLTTLALHGFFVNGVQTSLYALAAHVYVTRVRATGVAASLAIGRLGAIASAFVGASVIQAGSALNYVSVLAGCMLIALVAISMVNRHIPRLGERHGGS